VVCSPKAGSRTSWCSTRRRPRLRDLVEPQRYAEGVKFLFVYGSLVVDGGTQVDARPKRVVER